MTMPLPEGVIRAMAEGDPTENKDRMRAEIAQQTAEFLARGGKIITLAPEDSHFNRQPVKRRRQDQVAYVRKFHAIRAA